MNKRYLILLVMLCIGSHLFGQSFVKSFNAAGPFVKMNNAFYFTAATEANGIELWKSDGTTEGTSMVKDINPGVNGSNIQNIIVYNNKIYFSATDLINGAELWTSDGTESGTMMVKDINPNRVGSGNPGSNPRQFTILNGSLYFLCSVGSYDSSLWRTDGTAGGTIRILGGENMGLSQMRTVGNRLYINGGNYNWDLYASDGTAAGTKLLAIEEYGSLDQITVVNNQLVFAKKFSSGQGTKVYKLNPTDDSFQVLKTFVPAAYGEITLNNLTAVGSNFFFALQTDNGSSGYTDELWKSDGTSTGTILLKSFPWQRHISNSNMQNFVAQNGKLTFASTKDYYLWTSDGTPNGTIQVSTTKMEPSRTPLLMGPKIYFNTLTNQLWSYDGAIAKSELTTPAKADQLFEFDNKLFFTVNKSVTFPSPVKIALWNNDPSASLTVKSVFTTIENKGNFNITAKANNLVNMVITIVNNGQRELNLAEISVVGAPFHVTGTPARTLSSGSQTTFNLIYTPGKEEVIKGKLIIRSDDNENGVFSADLSAISSGKTSPPVIYSGTPLEKSITFAEENPEFVLSNDKIDENIAVGSLVGSLNLTSATGSVAYSFASQGDGNGSFKIENNQLKTTKAFDYEIKSVYNLKLVATTATSTVEKSFIVQVNDVQEIAPVINQCLSKAELLSYSLNDVAYTSTKLIAIGSYGKIISSVNDGKDWKVVPSPVNATLNTIKMFEQVGYILSDNVMLKTDDGGEIWYVIEKPDDGYPYLSRMYFYSATIGFLFGENQLYKTTDGGKSWKKLTVPGFGNIPNAMWFINENDGFSCGASKMFLSTKNGGDTWEAVNLPSELNTFTNFLALNFTSATVGYVSDQNGNIYQTKDGGNLWNKISTTVPASTITFINANTAYMLNTSGDNIYKTVDAGFTWARESSIMSGAYLKGFAMKPAGDKFCAVGWGSSYNSNANHAIFLKSGTDEWVKRSCLNYSTLYSTSWHDDKIGYVFGTNSFKTTDGGITWKQMSITFDFNYGINQSYFVSKDIGYCSGYSTLQKTIDGGETWTKVPTPWNISPSDIFFIDAQKGFVATADGIYRTTDGAATWQRVSNIQTISGPQLQFLNPQVGYAASIGYTTSKTTDGGATWSNIADVSNISVPLNTYFFDEQNALLGATNGQLYKTSDGGATWTEIKTQFQLDSYSFSFYDRYHGYLISSNYSNTIIFETFDGGETWKQVTTTDYSIRKLRIAGDNAYGVGGSAAILKLKSTQEMPYVNYITGDKIVAKGVVSTFRVPALAGVTYQWKVNGASQINYQNNSVEIIWKQTGLYAIEVIPQNACIVGSKYAIQVTVQDVENPVISGQNPVLNYSQAVEYTVIQHPNSTYLWKVPGSASFTPDGNKVRVNWGSVGPGVVSVAEIFNDFNLMKTASLPVAITGFSPTNFSVGTTSVTCKGSNNGIINIKATASGYNYSAVVTGPNNFNNTYPFSTVKEVTDLVPGTYSVCITIVGNESFRQCYNVNITEPKDLSVYANVKPDQQTLNLTLAGASTYFINVNGVVYQTSNSNFEVKLSSSTNTVLVSSDITCQGMIKKTINVGGVNIYPNPVVKMMHVDLGILNTKSVIVKISDLSGKLLYNKTQQGTEGTIQIDLENFITGIYIVQVISDNQKQTFKILKQ
ncbi:ELWxxDGT repeat protein [Pedobacter frigoris]|uniref:ELWxxDGT repeat protein n=1 Tax=Pedobacter frigoris TaxID=2571272 RepID=UPI00293006C5|nr:ELWxxDGT repeat protein [Pedobacter frigoris]